MKFVVYIHILCNPDCDKNLGIFKELKLKQENTYKQFF